ncbi:hypothetical protein F4827_000235 [Paraburkholderia bannensis]|uniref:Uncharacterized protein n=1 Tax=Paraburkholderia bannensis TaxID=765414 RepID=A0A7W9TTL3_9BURK|nr:hypothetical protein [Paraburkholderia sp. WP4_3_2]MBB6100431.1 hypothetical protein [Paraburkholderia bannensis]
MTTQTIRSVPRGVVHDFHDAPIASRQRLAFAPIQPLPAIDQRVRPARSVVSGCAFLAAA